MKRKYKDHKFKECVWKSKHFCVDVVLLEQSQINYLSLKKNKNSRLWYLVFPVFSPNKNILWVIFTKHSKVKFDFFFINSINNYSEIKQISLLQLLWESILLFWNLYFKNSYLNCKFIILILSMQILQINIFFNLWSNATVPKMWYTYTWVHMAGLFGEHENIICYNRSTKCG